MIPSTGKQRTENERTELALYAALIADLARYCVFEFEPVVLRSDGVFLYCWNEGADCSGRTGAAGEAFTHGFMSKGEYASHVLWAARIVEPVVWDGSGWKKMQSMTPAELPYVHLFRLRIGIDDISANIGTRIPLWPSLDYVLATWIYVTNADEAWGRERLEKEHPEATDLLKRTGYLAPDPAPLHWTAKGSAALRANWSALKAGEFLANAEWQMAQKGE